MSLASEIRSLLDSGDYLKAAALADEHKITDCKRICDHLEEINDISSSIKNSISMIKSLGDRLSGYESELVNVRDTAFQMEEREHAVEVQCKNLSDTCNLIKELLGNLQIPVQIQKVLLDGNLTDEMVIDQFITALNQLESVLRYEPDLTVQKYKCVRTQKEHANNIKSRFCDRLYQHFTRYVDYTLMRCSESLVNYIYAHPFSLPGHEDIHRPLHYMAPLVQWTLKNDRSTYQAIKNYYIDRMKTQYDKEIKIFFECAKEKMIVRSETASGRSIDDSDGFDDNVEKILLTIDPVCQTEQRFFTRMFAGTSDVDSTVSTSTQDDDDSLYEIVSPILVDMFHVLELEFIEFVDHYNSLSGLYSLYFLVRFSQYVLAGGSSRLFLMQIYPEILIKIKRNFDNFMEHQLQAIRDSKPPKTPKCGVLSVVKNFDKFARQVETLFKSTGARTDIDRWYRALVAELFKLIDRIEHNRTPTEMIRLENYYYLHDVLRSLKVPCLESQRKEANLQYKAALNAYVSRYFGRPLEKVNIFFEGVQAKVAQGVKEEEISFQLAFSKQELRKVLQMVTLKEVRKGLEDMYRRIEKHAYEPDSNLIQVIWHAMQDEFLSQYKTIQAMIERCYTATNLNLTFTIDDLLQVFSDIAQSH